MVSAPSDPILHCISQKKLHDHYEKNVEKLELVRHACLECVDDGCTTQHFYIYDSEEEDNWDDEEFDSFEGTINLFLALHVHNSLDCMAAHALPAPLDDEGEVQGLLQHQHASPLPSDNGNDFEKISMTPCVDLSTFWDKIAEFDNCISSFGGGCPLSCCFANLEFNDTEKISMFPASTKTVLNLESLIPVNDNSEKISMGIDAHGIENFSTTTICKSEPCECQFDIINERLKRFESSMHDFICDGYDEHHSLSGEDYVCSGFYQSCMFVWIDILDEFAEFKKPSIFHEVYECCE